MEMLNELQDLIRDAYANYQDRILGFRNQAIRVRKLKRELETMKLHAYANGEIMGKNQTERDAAEFALFESYIDEIGYEEDKEANLYRDKEIAELDVEYFRAVLRIMELTKEE